MAVEFDNPVRDPDYYLREANLVESKFEGKAAAIIGQEWSREAFLNLYHGYTTNDQGERDKKLPRYMHPDRRGAFDITFNLPKCVSITKELGTDSRIGDVLTKARNAAMKEVERQVDVRSPFIKSGNLVWTAFRHAASRAGDPHVHDHVVVFNLSRDPIKRSWKAIELRYIDRERIGEIYRDETIKGLNELGYKTRRVGREFEIVGVPAEVKAMFSSRHQDIDAREKEYEAGAHEFRKKKAVEKGMSPEAAERMPAKRVSAKAKQKLSVYDRPDKSPDMPLEDRRKGWLAQMTDHQRRAVKAVVKKARDTVWERTDLARWKDRIAGYASKLRSHAMFHEQETLERSRDHGRTR
ncbi:MAG: MobF family relaxase [Isosphaeraceae bacterium]